MFLQNLGLKNRRGRRLKKFKKKVRVPMKEVTGEVPYLKHLKTTQIAPDSS